METLFVPSETTHKKGMGFNILPPTWKSMLMSTRKIHDYKNQFDSRHRFDQIGVKDWMEERMDGMVT
jgi:hypothetical protein